MSFFALHPIEYLFSKARGAITNWHYSYIREGHGRFREAISQERIPPGLAVVTRGGVHTVEALRVLFWVS